MTMEQKIALRLQFLVRVVRNLRNQMFTNTLKTPPYSAAPCKPVMLLCQHS